MINIKTIFTLPSEKVHIYKSDLEKLKNGKLCYAFIKVEGNAEDFTEVYSSHLKVMLRIDLNKYEVAYARNIKVL